MRCKLTSVLLALLLTACCVVDKPKEVVHDRKNEYQAEQSAPRMKIPAHLSAEKISDFYEIPDTVDKLPSPDTEIAPPGAKQWQLEKTKRKTQSRKALIPRPKSDPKPVTEQATIATKQFKTIPSLQGFTHDMPTMAINSDFNNVWQSMEKALKVAKYPVVGKVKDLKTYFIVDAPGDGGRVRKETPIYQLHLIPQDDNTIVYVTDNDGQQLTNKVSETVLNDVNLGLQGKRKINVFKWFFNL